MKIQNKLTYISNAGIFLEIGGKKILIDGLSKSNIPLYKDTPKDIKRQIILGEPPYDQIDIMLITHEHSDHFNLTDTREFLKNNKNTLVLSTENIIKQIKDQPKEINKDNLLISSPPIYEGEKFIINDMTIHSISMLHDGEEYEHVENLAYLIDMEDVGILHVGDAKAIKDNYLYINSLGKDIDLLLVPFAYVGIPRSRKIIKEYIKPRKIAALHLPLEDLDKGKWINIIKRSYKRVEGEYIKTIFLENLGEVMDFF